MKDFINRIQAHATDFSKGQRMIAKYISEHYDKAAFMTAHKLGEMVSVSESTVVRFATEIGYDGYPQLQSALQEMVRNRLTAVQRLEVTSDRLGKQEVLRTVLISDIEKIKMTMEEIDRTVFENAVSRILLAKNIYIIGGRSSSSLASFLGFYFHLLFPNVHLVSTMSASETFEQMVRIGKDDVVIGISFPRYSRRTIQALKFAKNVEATVIALTDSLLSPLAQEADYTLIAKSDMASFADSLVAPLSVINALIAAVGMRKKDEIAETFSKLEKVWEEYDVYEKYDKSDD
ncbi:MAG: MurR/RpiR family transcriptional regulator [Clostridiales bacterium]|nr:MurR/RpiR family transcriptional regulator [Clostridiales bacterium]